MIDPDWPVFKVGEDDDHTELMYEVWGDKKYHVDTEGRKYTYVTTTLADDDFYQGLNKITVIKREGDGKLFGYQWWDDISKHGEAHIEPNGDELGLGGYCEVENDWDTFVSFYVFQPVEEWTYTGYRINGTSK